MNPTSNCIRIPAHCYVCNQEVDLLQAPYYVADRNGNPIYPAKCCSCGEMNIIYPLGNTGRALVRDFAGLPVELKDMLQKAMDRFGFNEGI